MRERVRERERNTEREREIERVRWRAERERVRERHTHSVKKSVCVCVYARLCLYAHLFWCVSKCFDVGVYVDGLCVHYCTDKHNDHILI